MPRYLGCAYGVCVGGVWYVLDSRSILTGLSSLFNKRSDLHRVVGILVYSLRCGRVRRKDILCLVLLELYLGVCELCEGSLSRSQFHLYKQFEGEGCHSHLKVRIVSLQ